MARENIKKSKIAFVIPNLNSGGAERVFVNYIRSLNKEKFEIILILIEKSGPFLELIPDYVQIIDLEGKRTRYSFVKLYKCVKKLNPGMIVSTTNYLNILLLMISFFISNNIKICLYEPSMPSAQFGTNHFPRYYLWLMKIFYRFSDYIIAQTEEMKSEIERYYSSPKEEIIVTINPLDTNLIQEQLLNSHNPYNNKKINIIVSGRISKEKGHRFLLKSYMEVVKTNKKFKLNILGRIGNQKYFEELNTFVSDNNLEEYVEFIKFKTNPFPYYKYADVLVLPSEWEGLPNVVLEALYLQTPVIVTDCVPYFYELIDEGKNGYIVKYGDENNLADKILKYNKLHVDTDVLNLPNYDDIFFNMMHN
jgi:glycosyltransferase involved in cell wall biosynthesis